MSKYTITIETDNDAFQPTADREASEVARILRQFANKLNDDPSVVYNAPNLLDINGNKVGEVTKDD